MAYLQILTFELTHENKSCSACPKDQHKHVTDTVTLKTKVVQHVEREFFKFFTVFNNNNFGIPGSQLLSDIQTFLFADMGIMI